MAKTFAPVDTSIQVPSTSTISQDVTNWKQCVICQEETKEPLTRPVNSKRKDLGSGYSSLTQNLIRFNQLNKLLLGGIEMAMVTNQAQYHQSNTIIPNCKEQKREPKHQRIKKILHRLDASTEGYKAMRKIFKKMYAFCGQPPGTSGLHRAATFQLDNQVWSCAVLLQDTELFAKLSTTDMMALEAKYHTKCLVSLYNCARKAKEEEHTDQMEAIAFAELVMYIEEQIDEEKASVFKLSDLYSSIQVYITTEQLGIKTNERVHVTRLKQHLLAQFNDMRAQKKGRDVLMAFEEDIGPALAKACELDSDSDAIHLARVAKVVRNQMFGKAEPFLNFLRVVKKNLLLLALVNMILEVPNIKDQCENTNPTAVSIAQLLKFKHRRMQDISQSVSVRHNAAQETPLPTYIGLMLHAHTRKKELVYRFYHLDMSISHDRVLSLSATMGSIVCKQFHREQIVCPPRLHGSVFTTAAVDSIDHNPSSTTSKESFHGTDISLLQHPTFDGEGRDRSIVLVGESHDISCKSVDHLPHFYTDVPPVTETVKNLTISATIIASLDRESYDQQTKQYAWLNNTKEVLLSSKTDFPVMNASWAAYHAS